MITIPSSINVDPYDYLLIDQQQLSEIGVANLVDIGYSVQFLRYESADYSYWVTLQHLEHSKHLGTYLTLYAVWVDSQGEALMFKISE